MSNYRILFSLATLGASLACFATDQDSATVPFPQGPNVTSFHRSTTPLDQSRSVRFGFGLAGFQKAQADAFVASQYDPNSANYHQWIDSKTFGQRFGAPAADIQAVVAYLTKAGFADVKIGVSQSFISASATLETAAKAFGVSFANYDRPRQLVALGEPTEFYGPISPLKIPESLAPRLSGAFGFTDLAIQHPAISNKGGTKAKQSFQGYSPSQVAVAYGSNVIEANYKGAGLNVGVYSPTTRVLTDPTTFATHFGIPSTFTIYDFGVDGGATGSAGINEAALDQEIIIGQAPAARIFMVEPPSSQAGELDAYDAVAAIGTIPIFTSSWGHSEYTLIKAGETAFATNFENVCESLAASGITLLHGAGDTAAYDSGDTGSASVTMEAACPYVTGVGGTSLTLNSNGTYDDETLWQYSGTPTTAKGGGGGISAIFKMPGWQTGYGVEKTGISNGYREVPDVSSVADPATAYYIVANGAAKVIGGCSSGGPFWAANLLLIEQYFGAVEAKTVTLGNLNPAIYTLGNWFENPTTDIGGTAYMFHDITVGSNGIYTTTPGYDMCAGWGTVNFSKAFRDIGYVYNVPNLLPDFEPFKGSGWTYPVMFHTSTTSVTEPAIFVHGTKYYVAVGAANIGTADGPPMSFLVKANGANAIFSSFPAMPNGSYFDTTNNFTYTFPSAGTYTITYTVNYNNVLKESNTTNDVFTRTITVQ